MTKTRNQLSKGVVIALSLLLTQCGGMDKASTSFSGNEGATVGGTFENAFGDEVQELQLATGANEVVLDESRDAILVLFGSSEDSQQNSFGLGSSINSGSNIKALGTDEEFEEEEGDLTSQFHGFLRSKEAEADEDYIADVSSDTRYATLYANVGDTQTFRVLNSFSNSSSYETVTAELKVQTQYFNFYVDSRDLNAFTAAELSAIADDFAAVIDVEQEVFGVESDVNSDGRFDILFTQVVNRLGGSQGGMVTGFFYAMDLFESSKYPVSNEREIIFVMVPDPEGEHGSAVSSSFAINNIIKGVLPHEYQHMINFNMHYFNNGGLTEKSWLNEGLSHLAEDLTTLDVNGDLAGFGLENPSRVASFLSSISNTCFTCGTSLAQRGGSYLFLKYLYEQAQIGAFPNVDSGIDMIQKILNTSSRGVSNLTAALYGNEANTQSFKQLMGFFSLALYFSETGLTSDDRFHIEGLDLRGAIQDNRGTFLNGPAIQSVSSFPFVDTVQGSGITYIKIPADQISSVNGVVDFEVSSPDIGAFVIQ